MKYKVNFNVFFFLSYKCKVIKIYDWIGELDFFFFLKKKKNILSPINWSVKWLPLWQSYSLLLFFFFWSTR